MLPKLQCSKCKDFKETSSFFASNTKKRGFSYLCRDCSGEQGKKRRAKLKAEGKCPSCGVAEPSPGHTKCADCVAEVNAAHDARVQRLRTEGLCVVCGVVAPPKDDYKCMQCRARETTARHKMRKKRESNGLCRECGENPKRPDSFSCVECCTARKRRIRELRVAVMTAYGGATCTCCGNSKFEFLTIDHVNNDGAEHRRQIREGGTALLQWLKNHNYPPGFQVLCYNCNCAKGANGGVCPYAGQDHGLFLPSVAA